MVESTDDPQLLAAMAKGRLQAKRCTLEQALHGLMGPHPRRMLEIQLAHIDSLDRLTDRLSQEIEARLRLLRRLWIGSAPSTWIGRATAEMALAELGQDMSRFPTEAYAAACASLGPGQRRERAEMSQRQDARAIPGCGRRWQRPPGPPRGVETAICRRSTAAPPRAGGAKRVAVAVARSLTVIIDHMLREGTLVPRPVADPSPRIEAGPWRGPRGPPPG